jgi:hypothetical protein
MNLKGRVGTFCVFCGALALLVFWASLQTPDKHYDLVALLAGAALIAVGWALRTAKPPAPPQEPGEPVMRPRSPGLFSGLGRKSPSPPPPPPAPPPKKPGLGARFKSKPDKALIGEPPPGRPAQGDGQRNARGSRPR